MKKVLIAIALIAAVGVGYVHFTTPRLSDIPKMKGKVLVQVYEEKCPWYQRAKKEVRNLLKWHKDIKMIKVEGSKNQAFREQYRINASPTWLVFDDGKLVGRSMGMVSAKKLWERMENPTLEEPRRPPPKPQLESRLITLERKVQVLERKFEMQSFSKKNWVRNDSGTKTNG